MPAEIYLGHAGEYLERYVSVHIGEITIGESGSSMKEILMDKVFRHCKVDTDTSQHPNPVIRMMSQSGWATVLWGAHTVGAEASSNVMLDMIEVFEDWWLTKMR